MAAREARIEVLRHAPEEQEDVARVRRVAQEWRVSKGGELLQHGDDQVLACR